MKEEVSRDCEGCAKEKCTLCHFQEEANIEDMKYCDSSILMCGSIHATSLGGSSYFLTYIDNF